MRHVHVDGKPTPRNAATKDHVEPRYYGGKTIPENMVAACCLCNNLRGSLEAIAFFNAVQRWFKNEPGLWERWHKISYDEYREYELRCKEIHARQLNGLVIRSPEHAFRHLQFVTQWHPIPLRV